MGVILFAENVVSTRAYTQLTFPGDLREKIGRKNHTVAVELKGEDGHEDGSYLKPCAELSGLHCKDALLRKCRDLFHRAPWQKKNDAGRDFGIVRVTVL